MRPESMNQLFVAPRAGYGLRLLLYALAVKGNRRAKLSEVVRLGDEVRTASVERAGTVVGGTC